MAEVRRDRQAIPDEPEKAEGLGLCVPGTTAGFGAVKGHGLALKDHFGSCLQNTLEWKSWETI